MATGEHGKISDFRLGIDSVEDYKERFLPEASLDVQNWGGAALGLSPRWKSKASYRAPRSRVLIIQLNWPRVCVRACVRACARVCITIHREATLVDTEG